MDLRKPLYLKTYGTQMRKLPAWISPDNRKQAFDSHTSSDGDVSVFEPRKRVVKRAKHPAKKNTRLHLKENSCQRENMSENSIPSPQPAKQSRKTRATRPAKKNAMLHLKENSCQEEDMSEENLIPSPQPAKQGRKTRDRKTSVFNSEAGGPARRKKQCLSEKCSDGDTGLPSPPQHQLAQQSKTSRKSRLVSVPGTLRGKRQHEPVTSESEDDSRASLNSHKMKATSIGRRSVASRFVTCRRRAVPIKSKLPKARVSVLNSSDEFIPETRRGGRVLRPSKRSVCLPSTLENSLNADRTGSFSANLLREISLNELTDHSLGPGSRIPIFCSTPSVSSFSKQPLGEPLPIGDQLSPPSMSGSCVDFLSTFQEDLDSPVQARAASAAAPPRSGVKRPSRAAGETSSKVRRCGEVAASHDEGWKTKTSPNPPAADSESSSRFVSASGGLDWLVDALKERCLTPPCTARLERLDHLTLSQLCGQTTYSSCLERSSSVNKRPTNDHSPSNDNGHAMDLSSPSQPSINLYLSGTDNDQLQSSAVSPSVAFRQSDEDSLGQLKETREACDKSFNSDANRSEDNMSKIEDLGGLALSREIDEKRVCTRQQANRAQTHDLEALIMTLKEKCLTDKLVVAIKKVEILHRKDAGLKLPTDISNSARDEQCNSNHQSDSDTNGRKGGTSSINVSMKKRSSAGYENNISSDKEGVKHCPDVPPKRGKASVAPREKRRKSRSADRPGTTRKACVSGLSVSRWKTKNSAFTSRTAQRAGNKAVDCSITELISTQPKQPMELLGTTMNFSTPLKASRLNLSSLLADLTPNTQTWNRLKAALSVHRKVLLTPKASCLVPGSPERVELTDLSQDLFATPFHRPRSTSLRSQLLSCSSLKTCEDADLSDAEKVYAECGQQGPLPWEECILPQRMKKCVKIGEGTFGEVFSTTNTSGSTVALKIIPLEGSEKVNGEDQKTFGEILHEIIISKELSSLKEKQQNQTHGFIGLNDLHCVRGCYPPDFLKAWDVFDKKKVSENDRPSFFERDQLFLILEFEFGGSDLENSNGTLSSLRVAKSILHQVTAALAVAEEELRFEHRDLHWGNVLVKTTTQKTESFLLNGTAHSVETKGVLVRVIDYSLSRLEIDDLTVSCDISNDEELFMGHGDYQFDIYRMMREENGNNWSNYHPHTNVLWLHYLCSKLLSMKYQGRGGKAAKAVREELTHFYDNVLQWRSATEALHNCPMFQ